MKDLRSDIETSLEMAGKLKAYNEALDENRYNELQQIFHYVPDLDPRVMYGKDLHLREQEYLFGKAVERYGGNFMTKLKTAYRAGDKENRRKIRTTWPGLWIQYVGMGEGLKRNQESTKE